MNKIKDFLKKQKTNRKLVYNICLTVTVLGLLFIVSGTSYALLTGSSSSDKEQIIKAGDVTIALTEYFENTTQKISVMSDTDGLLQEETYSFNLKNIGDVTAKYDIKLVNEVPSSYTDGVIDDKYVKIGIEVNGEEHGPFTLEEANNILDSGTIYENELISYEIRIWLSEDYEEEILELEGAKGFFKLSVEAEQSFDDITAVQMLINKSGTGELVAEEHPATEQLEANTDYRYTGANPNNYVSFNNESWRIIGVFPTDDGTGTIENRIKIIRNESIGAYVWDDGSVASSIANTENKDVSTNSLINKNIDDYDVIQLAPDPGKTGVNNWAAPASLNKYLNEEYYNSLTNEAQDMIGESKWYLGGTASYTTSANGLVSNFYSYERGIEVYGDNATSCIGKIGLMYPSDYGYATSGGNTTSREECLAKELYNWGDSSYNDCVNNDWLFSSLNEFTLTHFSNYSFLVFSVTMNGNITYYDNVYNFSYVRPVLYLDSTVEITGGSGTESDPYILSK